MTLEQRIKELESRCKSLEFKFDDGQWNVMILHCSGIKAYGLGSTLESALDHVELIARQRARELRLKGWEF